MNQPLQGERDDAEDMTALVAPPPAASTCLKKVWIVGKEVARECRENAEKRFFLEREGASFQFVSGLSCPVLFFF
jgi:hypothetical protein